MDRRSIAGSAQQGILGILVFLLSSTVAFGATFYVRLDGSNGNTGLTNNSGGAWRTIDWAADHASGGDTVRVQAGTYFETVTPAVNGTAGNTVTFVADGSVVMCGWQFSSNSYLRIIGFDMNQTAACTGANPAGAVLYSGTNTGLEFWNNQLHNFKGVYGDGFRAAGILNQSLIIGNVIHTMTASGPSSGYGNAITIVGDNNLVAYNEIYDFDYIGVALFGNYNRVMNINVRGLLQIGGRHPDAVFMGRSPSSFNLFEAFFNVGTPTALDNKWVWMENPGPGAITNNVFRRNVVHGLGSGGLGIGNNSASYPVSFTREYHNTVAQMVRAYPTQRYGQAWMGAGALNGYIYNDLNYENWGATATSVEGYYFANIATQTWDYNLAYDPDGGVSYVAPWTSQAHPRTQSDPFFKDFVNDDFTLSSTSSGAYRAGGPLTTTSGSGTGTTFNVVQNGAGFFRGDNPNLSQYEGNLVVGDTITVGTTTRTIASISGDAITVTQPFTWTNGQPVYFGASATPDIGAYPYKAGGYTLSAAYSPSAETVTPSDASLVRFVVCYRDGVPTTVDSTSPFTCSAGGGSLEVRVYPLYASKTLYVTAQPGPPAGRTLSIK